MIYAAQQGHIDIVKILIGEKAEVNCATEQGITALIAAADVKLEYVNREGTPEE